MKLFHHILTLSAIMLLAACSVSVRNDVSSFHHMPAPNGESVAIVPMSLSQDPESLEFVEYAKLVRKQLTMLGYTSAQKQEADLIVELGYGVKRERDIRRAPMGGSFGSFGRFDPWYGAGYGYYNWYYLRHNAFFYRNFYDPFYSPFYGPWGHGSRDRVMHNRNLMLDVRTSTGEKLYEGRVESLGRSKALPKVMPYMVEAMFADFPGESGTVTQVVIREEDEKE